MAFNHWDTFNWNNCYTFRDFLYIDNYASKVHWHFWTLDIVALPGIALTWIIYQGYLFQTTYPIFAKTVLFAKYITAVSDRNHAVKLSLPYLPLDDEKSLLAWVRMVDYMRKYYIDFPMEEASFAIASLVVVFLLLCTGIIVNVVYKIYGGPFFIMAGIGLESFYLMLILLNEGINVNIAIESREVFLIQQKLYATLKKKQSIKNHELTNYINSSLDIVREYLKSEDLVTIFGLAITVEFRNVVIAYFISTVFTGIVSLYF